MNFKLTRPCDNCPFRKEGGIRLRRERARDIAKAAILHVGSSFACHKTTDVDGETDDGEYTHTGKEQYCAGAIAFGLNNRMLNQQLVIAQRLGLWHPKNIKDRRDVFGSVSEMLSAQLSERKR